MISPYQNNDFDISVSITDSATGDAIAYGTITAATYKLMALNKTTEIASKTVGSGIIVSGDSVIVSIDQTDTVDLNTVYYHELQIVSGGKHSTVVSENVTFNETVI